MRGAVVAGDNPLLLCLEMPVPGRRFALLKEWWVTVLNIPGRSFSCVVNEMFYCVKMRFAAYATMLNCVSVLKGVSLCHKAFLCVERRFAYGAARYPKCAVHRTVDRSPRRAAGPSREV